MIYLSQTNDVPVTRAQHSAHFLIERHSFQIAFTRNLHFNAALQVQRGARQRMAVQTVSLTCCLTPRGIDTNDTPPLVLLRAEALFNTIESITLNVTSFQCNTWMHPIWSASLANYNSSCCSVNTETYRAGAEGWQAWWKSSPCVASVLYHGNQESVHCMCCSL